MNGKAIQDERDIRAGRTRGPFGRGEHDPDGRGPYVYGQMPGPRVYGSFSYDNENGSLT